jgi:hypothetical protein
VRRLLLALGLLGIAASALAPAAVAQTPFGHSCTAQPDAVRLCPTTDGSAGQTLDGVPSFDGVPLDVDVTLPQMGWPPPTRRS